MLLPESELKNYVLAAKDGDIGRSRDFVFDDVHWTVRYMEANTSKWLLGRRVLISPFAIQEPDISLKNLHVNLTTEENANAPAIEKGTPISRRYEVAYHAHFGYPHYWVGQEVWGSGVNPQVPETQAEQQAHIRSVSTSTITKANLRSMEDTRGYDIYAGGQRVGHVDDFIVDTGSWQIRYLVVDIRRWLPGPGVLLAPQWIEHAAWDEQKMTVGVDPSLIKTAPKFCLPLTQSDEAEVFDHYGLEPYWYSPRRRAAND